MTTEQPSPENRRDYYRISDNVAYSYSVMPADFEVSSDTSFIQEDNRCHQLLTDIHKMDTENQTLLQNLKDRDIRSCLMNINKKINRIGHFVAAELSSKNMHFDCVNISGGGLQFPAQKSIKINTMLKLELLLYPSCATIVCYGSVVNCSKDESAKQYEVSVQFTAIKEDDRDRLIKHVLQRQASQIRKKNGKNER